MNFSERISSSLTGIPRTIDYIIQNDSEVVFEVKIGKKCGFSE